MEIQHQPRSHGGLFLATEGGAVIGEMTYDLRPGGPMEIDHTWVTPAWRGGGVAQGLVDAGVAFARANGLKIRPICSYVVRVFDADRGLDDLRA